MVFVLFLFVFCGTSSFLKIPQNLELKIAFFGPKKSCLRFFFGRDMRFLNQFTELGKILKI
jgi:hypothetical protein